MAPEGKRTEGEGMISVCNPTSEIRKIEDEDDDEDEED